jgi:hypothetical protein
MADGQLAELMKCIMTIEHLLSPIAEGAPRVRDYRGATTISCAAERPCSSIARTR